VSRYIGQPVTPLINRVHEAIQQGFDCYQKRCVRDGQENTKAITHIHYLIAWLKRDGVIPQDVKTGRIPLMGNLREYERTYLCLSPEYLIAYRDQFETALLEYEERRLIKSATEAFKVLQACSFHAAISGLVGTISVTVERLVQEFLFHEEQHTRRQCLRDGDRQQAILRSIANH
jgi:hypothetical protein